MENIISANFYTHTRNTHIEKNTIQLVKCSSSLVVTLVIYTIIMCVCESARSSSWELSFSNENMNDIYECCYFFPLCTYSGLVSNLSSLLFSNGWIENGLFKSLDDDVGITKRMKLQIGVIVKYTAISKFERYQEDSKHVLMDFNLIYFII